MKIPYLVFVVLLAGTVSAQYVLYQPTCYYDKIEQGCAGYCADKSLTCTMSAAGACECQDLTPTTTLRYCDRMTSVKGQRECDLGDCPNGGACTYVPITGAYGYCTCQQEQVQEPSCHWDKEREGCYGTCPKGETCTELDMYECACRPKSAATTTTTTIHRLTSDEILKLYTTTTVKATTTTLKPKPTVTIPTVTLQDSDKDGVPNIMDDCPGTPVGTRVNARGCPLCSDSDADSDSTHYELGSVQVPTAAPTSPMDEYVTVLNITFDTCANGTHVMERYCNNETNLATEFFECPFGCADGACQCAETDGGINYDVQGVHGGPRDSPYNKVAAANIAAILDGNPPKMYAVNPAALSGGKGPTLSAAGLGSFYSTTPVHASDKPVDLAGGASLTASIDHTAIVDLKKIFEKPVAEYCIDDNTLMEYYPEIKDDKCAYKSEEHVCPEGCRLGRCMPTSIYNEKNASRFEGKQAFMTSDFDWRSGLRLVPLASWDFILDLGSIGGMSFTFNFDLTYPLLYYHRESSTAWDADAVIHFLQLYAPDKLTIFTSGEGVPASLQAVLTADSATAQNTIRNNPMSYSGPGLHANQLVEKGMSDYYGYWSTINSVVVSQDDYSTGMLAAVWASHLNAPLLFDGHFNKNVLNGRYVITVGDISGDTMDAINDRGKLHESFTKRSLQQRLVTTYSANRVVLVNPVDLGAPMTHSYTTDKNPTPITSLFYRDSLAAAYLASARNEVIIQTTATSWQAVDTFVENEFNALSIPNPGIRYLTIVSSPSIIPMARTELPGESCSEANWLEVDGRSYGTFGTNMQHQTLATGRIFGISVSDTSSMIAKSVLYNTLPQEREALLVIREDRQDGIGDNFGDGNTLKNYAESHYWTASVRNQFTTKNAYYGHTNVDGNTATIQSQWRDRDLIIHVDHGNWGAFCWEMTANDLNSQNIYYGPAVVLDLACETCKLNGLDTANWPNVNCVQNLRRGAVSYMGATDVSYWHNMFNNVLNRCYIDGWTIGRAYVEARNEDYDLNQWNFCSGVRGDPYYALIGDPLFTPRWW